jgi:amino acid transporter
MQATRKPTPLVLANSVFIVILALSLLLYREAYTNLSDMMLLIFLFPFSVALLVIGIYLVKLRKSFRIPLLNKLLPFISVTALMMPSFIVSKTGMLAGLLTSAALMILATFASIVNFTRHRWEKPPDLIT